METVAVYNEAKPRIYGFLAKKGLSLFKVSLPSSQLAVWGRRIRSLDEDGATFLLVATLPGADRTTQVCLLVDPSQGGLTRAALERALDSVSHAQIELESSAEMIYFQGPHFGDRYGIADAAFGVLREQGVPVLAAACTGATVQRAVAEGRSEAAIEALSTAFTSPKSEAAR